MNIKNTIGQGNFELIKTFCKRLLYIGICLLPIIVFVGSKGNIRFISFPFILIVIYQLIMIIALSLHMIEEFFPSKFAESDKSTPFGRVIFALFSVAAICMLFASTNGDNTINGTKLLWNASIIGIGVAITLTITLKVIKPFAYFVSNANYICLFFGLFFLTTALFCFINYHYADNEKVYCKTYTIIRKGNYRDGGDFIEVKLDDNTDKRFSIGKKRNNSFKVGETVEVRIVKGLFSFDFATDFNKIDNGATNEQ